MIITRCRQWFHIDRTTKNPAVHLYRRTDNAYEIIFVHSYKTFSGYNDLTQFTFNSFLTYADNRCTYTTVLWLRGASRNWNQFICFIKRKSDTHGSAIIRHDFSKKVVRDSVPFRSIISSGLIRSVCRILQGIFRSYSGSSCKIMFLNSFKKNNMTFPQKILGFLQKFF